MQIRYIQTAVPEDDYKAIMHCSFDEGITLSELLAKAAREYLERRKETKGKEEREQIYTV